jgi:glycosyltransferase involved in cell wall biosynthesis
MAARVPLVAPNTGGIRSYASDETAWLAEPTPQAFAAAVRALVDDPPRRTSRIARAYERAEQFRRPLMMRRMFALYDDLHADRLAAATAPLHQTDILRAQS